MNPTLLSFAAVGLGAGCGGMCRYALTLLVVGKFGPGLPIATLFINLSGSFLIGLLSELAQTRAVGIDPLLRIGLTTGVLGGYTTFSSFAFETLTLGGEREWRLALTYAVCSVVFGVALCYAGMVLARVMVRSA